MSTLRFTMPLRDQNYHSTTSAYPIPRQRTGSNVVGGGSRHILPTMPGEEEGEEEEEDDDDDTDSDSSSDLETFFYCPSCTHCRPHLASANTVVNTTRAPGGIANQVGRRGEETAGASVAGRDRSPPSYRSHTFPLPVRSNFFSLPARPLVHGPSPPPPRRSPPPVHLLSATSPERRASLLNPHPSHLSSGWYFFSSQSRSWYRPCSRSLSSSSSPATNAKTSSRPGLPALRPSQDQSRTRDSRLAIPTCSHIAGSEDRPRPSSSGWEVYDPAIQHWFALREGPDTTSPSLHSPGGILNGAERLQPGPLNLAEGWYYYSSASRRWWAYQNTLSPASRGWWYFAPSPSASNRWIFGMARSARCCPCCQGGTLACANVDQNGQYCGPGYEGPRLANQSVGQSQSRGWLSGEKLRSLVSFKKKSSKRTHD